MGISFVGALALGACGGGSGTTGAAGTGGGAAGTSGAAGVTGGAGTSGAAGMGAAGTSGAAGTGVAGTSGGAGSNGVAGTSGGAGMGAAGTSGGAGMGAAGTSGGAGMGAAGTGVAAGPKPTGKSTGCGLAPSGGDKAGSFTGHVLTIPTCGTGPITSKCVSPKFAPGGALSQTNQAGNQTYDFAHRHYALQLPANYDATKAYPLIIGGGGCGGGPTESGGGFSAGQGTADAIRVGLSYVKMCFADGGNSCAGTPANQPECVNTPELPYFHAVLADVEARYCVDKGKVYMGGYSSGGWDTFTIGCAAADVLHGIVTENGGLRRNRPACTGPIPALMVAGEADHDNPIGPMVMGMPLPAPVNLTAAEVDASIISLDSNGTAPARDEILKRNGCIGTETAAYDPAYPLCKKYTGCPASAPVVWCPITGAGHAPLQYMNVNYAPGNVAGNVLMWKFLLAQP
jgi:poly(3-hydroxybutyrate) depolymerase